MSIQAAAGSALLAGLLRYATAAENIARATDPSYRPRRVDLSTTASGGVQASVRERDAYGAAALTPRGRFRQEPLGARLADEAVEMLRAAHHLRANGRVLALSHRVQHSLLDILA